MSSWDLRRLDDGEVTAMVTPECSGGSADNLRLRTMLSTDPDCSTLALVPRFSVHDTVDVAFAHLLPSIVLLSCDKWKLAASQHCNFIARRKIIWYHLSRCRPTTPSGCRILVVSPRLCLMAQVWQTFYQMALV